MDVWSDLCRCCLASSSENVSLFEEEKNLKDVFFQVTSIEVTLEDGLPQRLCVSCFESMNTAQEFRTQCIKMDTELKVQLEKILLKTEPMDTQDEDLINGEDNEGETMKKLEKIIKTEPYDSDDDCYYVVVIDENSEDKENEPVPENEAVPLPIANIKTEPTPPNVEVVPEQIDPNSILFQKSDALTTQSKDLGNFESSLESFIISRDKVPINVPATILENEESQDDENFDSIMNVDAQNPDDQGSNALQDLVNDGSVEIISGDFFSNLSNLTGNNNLVKFLTTTNEDGTIVLKTNNEIAYLTQEQLQEQLQSHLDNEEENEDGVPQEVILCNDDGSSQFQVVNCDGTELVIQYEANDDQITTVLQRDDGKFVCDCGEAFDDLAEHEQHLASHNDDCLEEGDYLCNLCGKGFESAEILKGHMILHNNNASLILCPFCNRIVKRHALTKHIKYSHCAEKPQCTVCAKMFANPNNLKRHMMIHTGYKEFECDICLKRFHQKVSLQTHRLTHVNPLACTQCDEAFASAAELAAHRESPACPRTKIVRVKEALMKTVKQIVTTNAGKVVGYACSICQKMFSVESALEQHVESSHMLNPMELLCSECGEVLLCKKDMQAHIQTHKTVKNKSTKRHECPTCGKMCNSQAMLLMHERVHTNERPYPCQLCTLKFKTKTHLRTHQLTHTREKKFGCSICMKFFALKGNLVVHLRTHTGERPYVCSACGESFIDSKYLRKHTVKRHPLEADSGKVYVSSLLSNEYIIDPAQD